MAVRLTVTKLPSQWAAKEDVQANAAEEIKLKNTDFLSMDVILSGVHNEIISNVKFDLK